MPASRPRPESASLRRARDPWLRRREQPSSAANREPDVRHGHCAASCQSLQPIYKRSPCVLSIRARLRRHAVAVNHPKNLRRHFLNWKVRIHRDQTSPLLVIIRYRTRLFLVGMDSIGNHFFPVIIASDQLRAIDIADFIEARWLEVDVVNPSTSGTGSPPGDTAQQLIIVDVQAHHNRQARPVLHSFKELMLQVSIQPACLGRGSRKTIQNEAVVTVLVFQPKRHHVTNEVVWDKLATLHQGLGLKPQGGSLFHMFPQNVSSGDLRNVVMLNDLLGLCSLASSRRSQQY